MSKTVAAHPDDYRFKADADLERAQYLHTQIGRAMSRVNQSQSLLAEMQLLDGLQAAWQEYDNAVSIEFTELKYHNLVGAAQTLSSQFHRHKDELGGELFGIIDAVLNAHSSMIEQFVAPKRRPGGSI